MNRNPEKIALADLRVSYARASLDIANSEADAYAQFQRWMNGSWNCVRLSP